MVKPNELEEVKKLIRNGFDLELISFELDIPIEKIKQYKIELETTKKSQSTKKPRTREKMNSRNKQANSKMQKMREKYNKLYFTSNRIETEKQKKLPRQNVELINSIIEYIKERIENIKGLSKQESVREVNKILTILKQIEDYQLTIEQAEKIYFLLQTVELNSNKIDKNNLYIDECKRIVIKKLVEAIDIAQAQTEEVEELKDLERRLTMEMQKNNQIVVGAVRSRIENKITKIIQQKTIERIRNNIPENIEFIIGELANGTLDFQIANEIIDKESKKRVERQPKTRFRLTEEQEKRQILIQIRRGLMENAEQYHIVNPEKTIIQIQTLCEGNLEQAILAVVKNLTNIKDFERAKKVCDKFSKEDSETSVSTYIRMLKKQIRNEEISDIVLKGLNMQGTEKEEETYFELIEKGIKMGNINLKAVSLGKSQDGLRNITLANIWGDEAKKEKSR